jgi:CheY-like chemotaxis protein
MYGLAVKRIQKVLIVDDNPHLLDVLKQMLEGEGYEIKEAGNARFGYQAYLLFRPDLVITDIHMPDRNGVDLMKHIRLLEPEVRTIYMSGDWTQVLPLLEEERARHGAGLLEKPFSKKQLLKMISEIN